MHKAEGPVPGQKHFLLTGVSGSFHNNKNCPNLPILHMSSLVLICLQVFYCTACILQVSLISSAERYTHKPLCQPSPGPILQTLQRTKFPSDKIILRNLYFCQREDRGNLRSTCYSVSQRNLPETSKFSPPSWCKS